MALVTAELYWFRMLLRDLGISLSSPPTLWCDNASAISLASNPVFHAKIKHIEVNYHFIREKVLNKDILVQHISTHDHIANVFTEGHTKARFMFLRSKLMVIPIPISLQGNVKHKKITNIEDQEESYSYKDSNFVTVTSLAR
jgi:hypothetical protein